MPHFYTDVPPVNESIKKLSVPASGNTSLDRNSYKQQTEQEYFWLKYVREVLESQHDTFNNISWAAYHASHQPSQSHAICPTALLPLFLESAHTVAMIKHSFHVVKSAIEHLNPGQTPVIAFDQPLYALAKHIQWKWPENYGEDKFVIMFGGLHIEMAALKTLGDWLKGSGWVQALVQANITTPGIADSFLQAAHVTRTIRAHQVTVAALYILMHRAYDQYCLTSTEGEQQIMEFKQWCKSQYTARAILPYRNTNMQTSKHISTSNEQIWMHVFPHPAYKWLYLWNRIRYEHVTSIKLLLKARALIWYPIEVRLNKVCETKWQIWGFMYTLLA